MTDQVSKGLSRRHLLIAAGAAGAFGTGFASGISPAAAETLMEQAKSGKPIRLGYISGRPWCFTGPNGEPKGLVNAMAVDVLNRMKFNNIEPVEITDWAGLVPALNASRFDLITGGMFITKERCENVAFSDPIGVFSDVFMVPAGNPKNIQTYEDILKTGAKLVTVAGFNIVEVAKQHGIPDENVIKLPSKTEVLAALRSGRADVGGYNYFEAKELVDTTGGQLVLTDPAKMPEETKNWSGIAFRQSDADFVAAFNEAMSAYMGSEEMMKSVGEYGFTRAHLPGNTTKKWVCENR